MSQQKSGENFLWGVEFEPPIPIDCQSSMLTARLPYPRFIERYIKISGTVLVGVHKLVLCGSVCVGGFSTICLVIAYLSQDYVG